MNEKLFIKIFEQIETVLPEEWNKIAFYAFYFEGSYQMKFYVQNNKKWKDCYSACDLSDLAIAKLFIKINKIINQERNKLKLDDQWTSMTMVIDSKGHFKSNFDYKDFSENVISYEKKWKEKNLK